MVLPSGYTQVEYIESNWDRILITSTPILISDLIYMDCDVFDRGVQTVSNGPYINALIGSTQNGGYSPFTICTTTAYTNTTSLAYQRLGNTYYKSLLSGLFPYGRRELYCYGAGGMVVGSEFQPSDVISKSYLLLSSLAVGDSRFPHSSCCRLYRCTIFSAYDGGVVREDYIPCIEGSSGRHGVFAVMENVFYPFLTLNRLSVSLSTASFAYPVASDVTIYFSTELPNGEWYDSIVRFPIGSSSMPVDALVGLASYSITPTYDDRYYYYR